MVHVFIYFYYSPRYKPVSEALKRESDYSASTLLAEARLFVSDRKADLEVDIAEDLMEVDVPRQKQGLRTSCCDI